MENAGVTPSTNMTTNVSHEATYEKNQSVEVALAVFLYAGNVICVLAIVLNSVSLVAMMFLKDKSTAYHKFLKNLSVTDLLGAVSFLSIQHAPVIRSLTWMYIIRSLPWMFFTAYCLTLLCLSVIQYIAVCVPWKYSVVVTNRAVNIAIGCVWTVSTLQLLIPIMIILVFKNTSYNELVKFLTNLSKIETLVWMGVFVLVALLSTVLHISIHAKLRQLKKRSARNHDSDNMRMKQRAFVTMAILLCTGLLIRIPFLSMIVVAWTTTILTDQSTARLCNLTLHFLLYLNFLTDPCVYGVKLTEVRECYFELVCKIRSVVRCKPSRPQCQMDSIVATAFLNVKSDDDDDEEEEGDCTSPC